MDAILTTVEQSSLTKHERTIERGMATFVEVGTALAAIRDSKLYRSSHKTFEAYCQERWGWTRMRASQLIEAAESSGQIVNNCLQKPANEAQARPLSKLPKEQRAEVWEQAVETAPNGKVTAKHVEETVEAFLDDDGTDTEIEYSEQAAQDYEGNDLTPAQASVFEYESEIDEAIGLLKASARTAADISKSPAGGFLNMKQFRAAIKQATDCLEATRPYAICPYCEGRKCSACAQVGIVPKEVHEQAQNEG